MRIVQTSKAYYPLIGGVETVITNIAEGLSGREEIDVEVLVCNNEPSLWKKRHDVNGVLVTYVPMWTKVASLPISPSYPFHLAKSKGDILHIHEPFPLAGMSFLVWPRIQRNFSRLVISWHSDIVRQKWAMSMYGPIMNRLLEVADRIIVASPNHIDSSQFLLKHREKCEVIPYGIKLGWVGDWRSRHTRAESIRLKYGTPLLLFVGRLVYYKGLTYLIDALQQLPDAQLLIVGSGPLLSDLMKQTVGLRLEKRVKIIPNVSDEDLHAFYEACDVFVLPSSESSEAFGLVQIEAMACGKPVVSTNLKTGVTFVNQHGIKIGRAHV